MALNFSLDTTKSLRVDQASLCRYMLDQKNPAEYWRGIIFSEDDVKKDKQGRFMVSEPYWVLQPLHWLSFEGARKPGLLIRVTQYGTESSAIFLKIATPPFKTKANFKKAEEIISYAPWTELKAVSLTIPEEFNKDIGGLIKHLRDFKEYGIDSRAAISDHLNLTLTQRMPCIEDCHKLRTSAILKFQCPKDQAQQAMLSAAWARRVEPVKAFLEKFVHKYDVPIFDRFVEAPAAAKKSEAAKKSGGKVDKICVELAAAAKATAELLKEQTKPPEPEVIEAAAPVSDALPDPPIKPKKITPIKQAAKKRNRNQLDQDVVVTGSRERKKAKRDGEEASDGEEKSKDQGKDKKVAEKPKRHRSKTPGGYNTTAKKTEQMFTTVINLLQSGNQDPATLASHISELPGPRPKRDKKKKSVTDLTTNQAVEEDEKEKSTNDADSSFAEFLKKTIEMKDQQIKDKDQLILELRAQILELKDSELKQYKAGIRDYRGIEGTPEKKNKG
jgi:hypothetical protein